MKKIFILSLLILSACSKSDNNNPTVDPNPTEEVYNLDANGIGFFAGSPQVEQDPRIDLSTVVQGQKKSLVVTIKNMGSTATAPLTASLSNSNFYITSSTCSSKSLPPNGGSCSLTLNFSGVNKALQVFDSILQFGTSSAPVRIEVISSAQAGGGSGGSGGTGGSGGSGGSPLIKMYDGSTQIISPPVYSIGQVSGTAKISKVITIKNEGTATTLVSAATLSSSSFYLTSNGCVGKQLLTTAPNNQCTVTVNFSGSAKIAGQTYSSDLTFAGQSISLSASVASSVAPPPPNPQPPVIVFMDGSNTLSQDLSLGSYSENITLSKTLTVKNIGTGSSSSLSLQLLNNAAGYFTMSNSCVNKILAPNDSCSFSLRVSTNKPVGVHSVELKMDQTSQVVAFEKLANINSNFNLSLITSGPGQVSFNSQNYSSNQNFSLPSGSSISLIATPAANAQLSFNGENCSISPELVVSCSTVLNTNKSFQFIFSCKSGFVLNQGACVLEDVITYTPVYSAYSACSADQACEGPGTKTKTVVSCDKFRNGQPDGSAAASNCLSQAQDLTVSCDSPAGEATVAMDHGSKVIYCEAGASTGSFVSGTCTDAGYSLVGESCQLSRHTVSVSKSKNYGDVTSQPLGINCANVSSCQFDFDYGTQVTLYPTVSLGNGYAFGGWSGACSGTGSCSFTVDGSKYVEMLVVCEPNFNDQAGICVPNELMLTTRIANAIGGSIIDGNTLNCPAESGSCTNNYVYSSVVALTAVPSSGYTFSGWSGDCSGTGPCIVDMSSSRDVTATFSPNSTVEITIGYSSASTVRPPMELIVGSQTINITKTSPPSVLTFSYSDVDVSYLSYNIYSPLNSADYNVSVKINSNPAIFEFIPNQNLSIDFEVSCLNNKIPSIDGTSCESVQHTLTTEVINSVGGSIIDGNTLNCTASSGICSTSYSDSSIVTLTAVPSSGYSFSGWSGDCSGIGVCVITMSSSKSVSASFSLIPVGDPIASYLFDHLLFGQSFPGRTDNLLSIQSDQYSYRDSIILADNKVVMLNSNYNHNTSLYENTLVKFGDQGLVDTNFGVNGYVTLSGRAAEVSMNLMVISGNKILVIGGDAESPSFSNTETIVFAKLNLDGSMDTTFGNNGVVETNLNNIELPIGLNPPEVSITHTPASLETNAINVFYLRKNSTVTPKAVVDNNGKILIGTSGYLQKSGGPYPLQSMIMRFNSDGSVDNTFGRRYIEGFMDGPLFIKGGGAIIERFTTYFGTFSVNSNNDILATMSGSGPTDYTFIVKRYINDGQDIDSSLSYSSGGSTLPGEIRLRQQEGYAFGNGSNRRAQAIYESNGKILVIGNYGETFGSLGGQAFLMKFDTSTNQASYYSISSSFPNDNSGVYVTDSMLLSNGDLIYSLQRSVWDNADFQGNLSSTTINPISLEKYSIPNDSFQGLRDFKHWVTRQEAYENEHVKVYKLLKRSDDKLMTIGGNNFSKVSLTQLYPVTTIPQITVNINAPSGGLIFVNTDSTHGGDGHSYYAGCSNQQCSLTFDQGTNVVLEFQNQSGGQANGWSNCPYPVEGGPGQFFCNLQTAWQNFDLSFDITPVSCENLFDPNSCSEASCNWDYSSEIRNCSDYFYDETNCSTQGGCYWASATGTCNDPGGNNPECSGIFGDQECMANPACQWIEQNPAFCSGSYTYFSGDGYCH